MSTTIHPEVSKKNPYWIEKHRYYELKHFCLQYPIWKKLLSSMSGVASKSPDVNSYIFSNEVQDPTFDLVTRRSYILNRVEMIDRVTKLTDPILGEYIKLGVTDGISYDILRVRYDVPCGKDAYYESYRKFFWLLDRERD